MTNIEYKDFEDTMKSNEDIFLEELKADIEKAMGIEFEKLPNREGEGE